MTQASPLRRVEKVSPLFSKVNAGACNFEEKLVPFKAIRLLFEKERNLFEEDRRLLQGEWDLFEVTRDLLQRESPPLRGR